MSPTELFTPADDESMEELALTGTLGFERRRLGARVSVRPTRNSAHFTAGSDPRNLSSLQERGSLRSFTLEQFPKPRLVLCVLKPNDGLQLPCQSQPVLKHHSPSVRNR